MILQACQLYNENVQLVTKCAIHKNRKNRVCYKFFQQKHLEPAAGAGVDPKKAIVSQT